MIGQSVPPKRPANTSLRPSVSSNISSVLKTHISSSWQVTQENGTEPAPTNLSRSMQPEMTWGETKQPVLGLQLSLHYMRILHLTKMTNNRVRHNTTVIAWEVTSTTGPGVEPDWRMGPHSLCATSRADPGETKLPVLGLHLSIPSKVQCAHGRPFASPYQFALSILERRMFGRHHR